eukprot:1159839-Pelagomonas_calceolata.AAC.2
MHCKLAMKMRGPGWLSTYLKCLEWTITCLPTTWPPPSLPTLPSRTLMRIMHAHFFTMQYIEVDIDVSANNVASYVTAMVRGATKSLTIDMGEWRHRQEAVHR